ncbi:MAG: methylenetetrahydrofolate reductase [bacterium]
MTFEGFRAELQSEIEELEKLHGDFEDYIDSHEPPYEWDELRVLAGLLHDFYNGVENFFKRVVTRIDQYPEVLGGDESHQALLRYMSQKVENTRPPVISDQLRYELENYLRFRHVVRHAYGHRYKWDRMKSLVKNYPEVYKSVKDEFISFLDSQLPIEQS